MPTSTIVAGASGYIGSHLVNRFEPGAKVACISRAELPNSGSKPSDHIFVPYDDIVRGDWSKLGGFAGGSLVHLIGTGRGMQSLDIWSANVASTEMLLQMAKQLKLSRIVYLSGFGIPSSSSSSYYQAKQQAERLIIDSGFPHLILRCSYVVGRQDELTPAIIDNAIDGRCEIPGSGKYRIQPLFIDDLVSVILAVLSSNTQVSKTVDVLGEAVSFEAFVRKLLKRLHIECELHSRTIEEFVREAVLSDNPALSLDELGILMSDIVGPPTRQVFGVKIRGIEAVIESVSAQWLAGHEHQDL